MIGRILRWLVGIALALTGAFLALSLLYLVVTPPSTLMLGRWLTLAPVDRRVVALGDVAESLPRAVINSEDARYCAHGGVDWDALRTVIDDEEGPSRGASTIPMQVAKNVFLWPDRSYLRKGLEIPIALWLDLVWPKRRTMEIYLNMAEWGEGVFGAEAAAQAYFRKSARALTPREAALLATALPNPKRRNPARPSPGHRRLADRLLARMAGAGPVADCVARGG